MSAQEGGWGALFSGRNAIRSVALAGGVGLHAINVYVATTILPSVVSDIGGLDYYAWNTTLFVVASIIGSALSPGLLRSRGPRGAYGWAALLFAFGTLGCALSPSMPVMLIGRSIQGLGGGFLFALSYGMIRIVFPETLWPRAMGLISGMWGVATLVGPAIGGIFAEIGAWRAAFWSMILVVGLFGGIAVAVLPSRSGEESKGSRTPLAQLVLLSLSVLAVSAGSVRADLSWNLGGIVIALVGLAALVAVETRAGQRLLPRGSFRLSAPLALTFATMSLLTIAVTTGEMFIPLFLQVLHGQSPLIAGYLAAVMAAGWTVGSIGSSGQRGRNAARTIMASPLVAFAGMLALVWLIPTASGGEGPTIALLCLALAVVGIGVGLGWPHMLTRVLQLAPEKDRDIASAAITTTQLFATAIGAALAGMVANLAGLSDPGGIAGTSNAAFWLLAVFSAAPALALVTAGRSVRGAADKAQLAVPSP
ncbi:MFS transporter [Labrys sp. La1]|uniref:MFS transporter n=1 Tax=Labrys sp. La1 TaxID=3404917 RepID=UPI003EBABD12